MEDFYLKKTPIPSERPDLISEEIFTDYATGGYLWIETRDCGERGGYKLDKDEVAQLRDYLTVWLKEQEGNE